MNIHIQTEKSALITHDMDPEKAALLQQCVQEIDGSLDYHPEIVVYGRICRQRRSVGFYSDVSRGYRFSGQVAESKPLTPGLRELLTHINDKFSAKFNGILVNKYETGEEYIGRHSDDERGLQPNCGVVLVSWGAIRTFRIRCKATKQIVMDLPASPNQIIQMAGDFQREFTHEIPVEKRIRGCRYSFTFRRHAD